MIRIPETGPIRRKNMSELMSMKNIGKEMAKKLISVGIESSEELIETDRI